MQFKNTYSIGIDARLWDETGVGRYVRNLVKELAMIDKENEYAVFLRKKDFENVLLPEKNFRKVLADVSWHSIEEQIKLPQILLKEHLDLMHFPYFSVPLGYNRPFVVTIHDLILHNFPTAKASTKPLPIYLGKQLFYRLVVSHAARHAKKIIAVSDATKKEIEKTLSVSGNNIAVTYEGIDTLIKSTNKKPVIDGKYFLYVGNAYPHKNVSRLLEAFAQFQKTHKDVLLVLVGKEDYFYKRLEKLIVSLELEKNIKILQDVSDESLSNLYTHAIALLIPSLMEGFGLPGLEAMSQGCLVLASDIPSLSEIYQDGAVYADPYSLSSIAKGMQTLYTLTSKEKDGLLQKEKKQALKFSWSTMAAQTLKVYESCVSL